MSLLERIKRITSKVTVMTGLVALFGCPDPYLVYSPDPETLKGYVIACTEEFKDADDTIDCSRFYDFVSAKSGLDDFVSCDESYSSPCAFYNPNNPPPNFAACVEMAADRYSGYEGSLNPPGFTECDLRLISNPDPLWRVTKAAWVGACMDDQNRVHGYLEAGVSCDYGITSRFGFSPGNVEETFMTHHDAL